MSAVMLSGPALLESRMQQTFGMSFREYTVNSEGPVPKAYLSNAVRMVRDSGVLPEMERWESERRKSRAGRKAIIPMSAVLVLFLLNVQMGHGVTYLQLAKTLDIRFGREEFATLGIKDVAGDHDDWYQRIWQAADRMLELVDPYPAPRDHNMKAAQFQELRESATSADAVADTRKKLDRINWLCHRLLVASVRMLPADIWNLYGGNTIIDATKLDLAGRPNSADPTVNRSNPDPHSGRYRREGSHGGLGAKTDVAAYELETAVMGWNQPGENALFPSLITAVSFHRPGEIIGHGAKLVKNVREEYGFNRILVIVDRAYNGEKVENFHVPIRLMGCELVIDYKTANFGIQGYFGDLIMVDGTWHVKWMPALMINATKKLVALSKDVTTARDTLYAAHLRDKKPKTARVTEASAAADAKRTAKVIAAKKVIADAPDTEAKLQKLIEARRRYRMLPKGVVDADGFQRFTYPGGDLTGKAKAQTRKSITIPLLIPEGNSRATEKRKAQPIKFLQKFACKSETWKRWFGMRSLVESSNNLLKLASAEDIGNSKKRSGRGFAFNYIAATLAAISSNIRRIITFFEEETKRSTPTRIRDRRRKDEHGQALDRGTETGLTAPGP